MWRTVRLAADNPTTRQCVNSAEAEADVAAPRAGFAPRSLEWYQRVAHTYGNLLASGVFASLNAAPVAGPTAVATEPGLIRTGEATRTGDGGPAAGSSLTSPQVTAVP